MTNRKIIIGFLATVLVVTVLVVAGKRLTQKTVFRADLATLGQKYSKTVVRVTFPGGLTAETLASGNVYLITVPDDPAIASVPLDQALSLVSNPSQTVNYYGYKFSSADAVLEKANHNSPDFTTAFPGEFFASVAALNDPATANILGDFLARNPAVTLKRTDDAVNGTLLQKNTQYYVVVNETGNMTFRIRSQGGSSEANSSGNSSEAASVGSSASSEANSSAGSSEGSSQSSAAAVGTLTITGNNSFPARLLLGGTVGDPVLSLDFQASGEEPIDVTSIQFYQSMQEYGSAGSVESIELWEPNGTQAVAAATQAACAGLNLPDRTFCVTLQGGQFTVPANQTRTLQARPHIKTDTDGGWPTDSFRLFSGDITAKGVDSNQNATINITGTVSAISEITMAKVLTIENASLVPDGTPVPGGDAELARFKFHAAPNNNALDGVDNVWLHSLNFTVNAGNATLNAGNFAFYDVTDAANAHLCSAVDSNGSPLSGDITGTFYVMCTNLENQPPPVPFKIIPNEEKTYGLKGTVVSSQVDANLPSSLRVILENLDPFGTDTRFGWFDIDSGWDGSGNGVGDVTAFQGVEGITTVTSTIFTTAGNGQ